MDETLKLVDRLKGTYILPVNDGCGPLDGKMVYERVFKMDPVQVITASVIEQLEAGKPYTKFAVQFMIDQLLEEKDWAGLGLKPYVAPINYEAIEVLKTYL